MSIVSDGATLLAANFNSNTTQFPELSFFCWVNYSSVSFASFFSLSGTSSGNYGSGLFTGGSAPHVFAMDQVSDADAIIFAEQSAGVVANKWVPIVGTLIAGSVVTLYAITSSGFHTGTGSIGKSTFNQIQLLGGQTNGGAAGSFLPAGSKLAECAIWPSILTQIEQEDLVLSWRSPWEIRPTEMLTYLPLRDDWQDYGPNQFAFNTVGTGGLTFSGDHPLLGVGPAKISNTFLLDRNPSAGLRVTLPNATISAAGKVLVSGGLTQTLANATIAAIGDPIVKGTLTQTLANATIVASAGEVNPANLTETLANATISATGGPIVAGALTANAAAATLSASGGQYTLGTLSETLPNATISATGSVKVAGALASTVTATLSATASVLITGALTATSTQTISATAKVLVAGGLTETLPNATISATAKALVVGGLTQTLANATISAHAGPLTIGGLTETLAPATISAKGGPVVGGALTATVSQTISAHGGPIAGGALSATTAAATISASAEQLVNGHLNVTLAPITLSAHGGPIVVGNLNITTFGAGIFATAGNVAGNLSVLLAPATMEGTAFVTYAITPPTPSIEPASQVFPWNPFIPSLKTVLLPQNVLDTTINSLGMRLGWMKSHACPCTWGNPGSNGSPNPRCNTCFGRGTYWENPLNFVGLITFMHTSAAPDEPGILSDPVMGNVMRSAPTLTIPFTNADGTLCPVWPSASEKDAYVETDTAVRFNTPLIVGGSTYLPYRQNLKVLNVTSYNQVTQTAQPVTRDNYTIDGSSVTLNEVMYPEGTAYVVEYTASNVYVAFRASGGVPHSRPAGSGANLPRRFHVESLDVWVRNLNNPNAQAVPI